MSWRKVGGADRLSQTFTRQMESETLAALRQGTYPPPNYAEFLTALESSIRRSLARAGVASHEHDDLCQDLLLENDRKARDGRLAPGFDPDRGSRLADYLSKIAPLRARDLHRVQMARREQPLQSVPEQASGLDRQGGDQAPGKELLRFRSLARGVTQPHRVLGCQLWRFVDWSIPEHEPIHHDLTERLDGTEGIEGLERRLDASRQRLSEKQRELEQRRDRAFATRLKLQNWPHGEDVQDVEKRLVDLKAEQRARDIAIRQLERLKLSALFPLRAEDLSALLAVTPENAWQLRKRARAGLARLMIAPGRLGEVLERLAASPDFTEESGEEDEE
jgi:hypothetical protein